MGNTSSLHRVGRRGAFTLVELLVVIGIIALLISILLPTLNRARESAAQTACASNIRQMALAAIGYATDNNGTFNWSLWANRATFPGGKGGYANAPTAAPYEYMTLQTALSPYMGGNKDGQFYLANNITPAPAATFGGAWECPSVSSEFAGMQRQYANNPLVMVDIFKELAPPGGAAPASVAQAASPAKQTAVYTNTAIFWDAPATVGYPFLNSDNTLALYFASSGVDYFNTMYPSLPDVRYYSEGTDDPNEGDPDLGLDYPVSIIDTTNGGDPLSQFNELYANAAGEVYTILAGAPVFRHKGQSICNMAFADGSARGMKAFRNQPHPVDPSSFVTSEFVRRDLRIKYPSRYFRP